MIALGEHPRLPAPATTLSALGATLTLTFARMAKGGERLEAGADVEDMGLTERSGRRCWAERGTRYGLPSIQPR